MGGVETRKEVRSVLSGIVSMLSNVAYVFPGDNCKPNTYAYVYPRAPLNKNRRGEFIFHLCPLYMTKGLGEQIETLTHEGSHHELMYRNDECMVEGDNPQTCTKAYGRTNCRKLVENEPAAALKNADNICYFINAAAEAHMD